MNVASPVDIDLSVIVVRWKDFDQILYNYFALQESNIKYEYIVVNNGPDVLNIPEISNSNFKLLDFHENYGFAKASNLGVKSSSGKFLLFLNPDIVIKTDVVDYCLNFINQCSDCGILTPLLKLPDGRIDSAVARKFPTIFNRFLTYSSLNSFDFVKRTLPTIEIVIDHKKESFEVPCVNGAFMLMKRETFLDVNGFSEKVPLFNEDIDLCYKINMKGMKTFCLPQRHLIHARSMTVNKENNFRMSFITIAAAIQFFTDYKPNIVLPARLSILIGSILGGILSIPMILIGLLTGRKVISIQKFIKFFFNAINSLRTFNNNKVYSALPVRVKFGQKESKETICRT